MKKEVTGRLNMWISAFPRIAGGAAIVAGSIVLIGWVFDIPLLKSLHPDLVSMKANAGLAFVLAGMSLLILAAPEAAKWRRTAGFLALLVFLIGLISCAEYVFKWDAGIEQLLFNEPKGTIGTFLPGRMAFNTAMSFCLFGLAILLHNRRSRWSEGAAQVLALIVGMLGLLALVAHIYGLPGSSGFAVYTRMALHTSGTFILLSIGLTCLQPNVGVMAVIRGEGSGGFMARRLMPAAVVVPILLCWVVARGEIEGFYGNQFGEVIDATAYVAIALYLIWMIGRSLNKLDAERKKLELSLLKSEREFKELFDNAPVGYHEVDGEGAFCRINETELRMLGYQAEEMLGHFAWEFVGNQAESRDALLGRLAGTLPQTNSVERTFTRKDGTTIIALIEDRVVRDAEGHIVGLRATLQNVTERRQAEEALVVERSLLRTLIDHLPDTIYVKDAACRKTLANANDVRNMGASSEAEVLGKTDFDFYPRELAGAFYADDQSIIQSGRPILNREEMITLPDGAIGWQLTSKVPLRGSAGQVVGLVGIGHDITERRRAEQERESLINELKTALENVRTLGGLVPICAHCKKIRDDKGYWNQLEKYLVEHTDAKLTHGLCPDCAELYFPGIVANTSPGGNL